MSASSTLSITNSYSNKMTSGAGTAGTLTDTLPDTPLNVHFEDGTGDNQIDRPWSYSGSLTNSHLDLTLSALSGPGSGTTALAKGRKVYVRNNATVAGNTLTLDFTQTHGWAAAFTGTVVLPAGGGIAFWAPLSDAPAVASGSGDVVRLTATGTVPFLVSFEGTSV